jgi:hypothetical protein
VGTSENDFNDFYHDDPAPQIPKNKLPSKFIATGALILGSILFFQGTFAGNISLNSGRGIEFGQGVSQAVACSGNTDLTLTPYSSFANSIESGTHYLERITVSNIPTQCRGADFTIRAYNDTSNTPLSLFNTNSTSATIQTIDTPGTSNDSATAWAGASGITASASTTGDAFTITFTTPAASSSEVAKITLESNKPYYYGGPGPGGGTVFYVSTTGFNCGPAFTARCKYLEAAPSGWNGSNEGGTRTWAQSTPIDYHLTTVSNASSPETATATAIGWGYFNTRAIVLQGNTNPATSAAALADSYSATVRGIAIDDWYLPSKDELNQMCKWQRGVAWTSDATVCTGGTTNTGPGAAGFVTLYQSSSEAAIASRAWKQFFQSGGQIDSYEKSDPVYVRPIRAF